MGKLRDGNDAENLAESVRPQCSRVRHCVDHSHSEATLEIEPAAILGQITKWHYIIFCPPSVATLLLLACVCPWAFLDCSSAHTWSVNACPAKRAEGHFLQQPMKLWLYSLQLVPPALYATCDLLHKWYTVLELIYISQGEAKPASCLPDSCTDLKELDLAWFGQMTSKHLCRISSKFHFIGWSVRHQLLSTIFKSTATAWLLISEYLSVVSRKERLQWFML